METAVKCRPRAAPRPCPDPPEFKKCVAAKKKAPAPEGQGKQTDAALKKQCKTEYDTLKREVMQFLIQSEWVQQEAEKRDIEVKDAEIQKTLEDQKKQAFPTDKAYKAFLKTSGMTEADILFRVKLSKLQEKLTKAVTEDAKKVSTADVQEYYDKNKKRFAQPERRDLLVVLTKTEAKADEARAALDGGQAWKDVVKQYSIDEASKAQGGKLAAVAKGQQDKALEDAVFAAGKGELQGPVKTQFGWYVFEVEKITPASQQSLEQATRHDQEPAALRAPAEVAGRVRQGLPRGLQGQDELRRRLPRRRSARTPPRRRPTPVQTGGATPTAPQPAEPEPAAREVVDRTISPPRWWRLDEITRRLRRDCPWDREQDERSIVPHTVEEAYELADAAHSGDDAKLRRRARRRALPGLLPVAAARGARRRAAWPAWPSTCARS